MSDTGQRKPQDVLLWTSGPPGPPGPPGDASPVGSGLAASALRTAQRPPALVICGGTYRKKMMRGRRDGRFRVQRDRVVEKEGERVWRERGEGGVLQSGAQRAKMLEKTCSQTQAEYLGGKEPEELLVQTGSRIK